MKRYLFIPCLIIIMIINGCDEDENSIIRYEGILLTLIDKSPVTDTWVILAGNHKNNISELILLDSVKTNLEGQFQFNYSNDQFTNHFTFARKDKFLNTHYYWQRYPYLYRVGTNDTLYIGSQTQIKIIGKNEGTEEKTVSIKVNLNTPEKYLTIGGIFPVGISEINFQTYLNDYVFESKPFFYDLNKTIELKITVNGEEHIETYDMIEFETKEIEIRY